MITAKLEREIKRSVTNHLFTDIQFYMYEYTEYNKEVTPEEVADEYIKVVTETINHLIEDKHLYNR